MPACKVTFALNQHSTLGLKFLYNHPIIFLVLVALPIITSSPVSNPSTEDTGSAVRRPIYTPTFVVDKRNNTADPRRIICGYQLIVNLKMQCGERGTFSPYERGPRMRRGLRLGKASIPFF